MNKQKNVYLNRNLLNILNVFVNTFILVEI